MVVPATNFTAGFPKIGYIGINKIFDNENVNYSQNTITQASDLKNDLESMKLNRKEVTTISLGIEAMYPSITFNMVRKAIDFFSKDLNDEQKIIIKDCLKMIGFGMGNTLITFKNKYYDNGVQRI